MALSQIIYMVLLVGFASTAPVKEENGPAAPQPQESSDDLVVDASASYGHRYSDWNGYPGSGNYNSYVNGYGLLDEKYNPYNGGIYDGYDKGNTGYTGYVGNTGGYGGYRGYGGSGTGYRYGVNSYAGNGGYGGYGGNGGIGSYYGYNNPYYEGNNHLGHGYYNKKIGYGTIYNSGITPSLVTGYRGYSRR